MSKPTMIGNKRDSKMNLRFDPVRATNFNRTTEELELFLLFCVLVAGKNATTTSLMLERLLKYGQKYAPNGTPFQIIKAIDTSSDDLAETMRGIGFGCFNIKSKSLRYLVRCGLNLNTCTADQLEGLHGIGMKTSRYFILHSRRNAQVACLDTHLRRWLSEKGYDVPKTLTRKKYLELEKAFLKIAKTKNISPCDLDLQLWNKSRGSDV